MREQAERARERAVLPIRSHAARALIAFGVFVAVAIVAITGYEIVSQRDSAIGQARRELAGLNLALAEHTGRVLVAADRVIADVAAGLQRREGDTTDLPRILRNHAVGLPAVAALLYADAEGRVLAHSSERELGGVTVADRDYFLVQRERPAGGLHIGEPHTGRIAPRPQIALSRAVADRNGRFRGIAAAGLETAYLEKFFGDVAGREGGDIYLFRRDGRLLVQHPAAGGARAVMVGRVLPGRLAAAPREVFRLGPAGRGRLVSYRSLDGHPLAVAIAIDEDVLLAPWRRAAWRLGATAVGGIAVVWLLVAQILRRMGSEARQAARLAQSEEQFRVMVERASDALILHDMQGRIVMVNQLACATLGYTCQELTGRHVGVIAPAIDIARPYALWQEVTVDHPVTVESEHRRKDGTTFPVEVRLGAFEMAGRRLILALARDISERKAYQARLEQQANHDLLTGLPNRMLFLDRLATALAAARRNRRGLVLMFLDLDGFKRINDTLGHAAGDALLVECGRRIAGVLREADTVARFGGDEFVVLLPEVDDPAHGTRVAAKIREAFLPPFDLAGRPVAMVPSIGVAHFPADGEDADGLLSHADAAMYREKTARPTQGAG
ncbi:MAG: diguanylate cyclase [Sterolibacteriaceae bacterium MAG5]|nr:diguanylate cyclase [Candidatus Nitricoxidireducens bremensis]